MDYSRRVRKLKDSFIKKDLDGVLVSSPANMLYLSGYSNFILGERESFILITKSKQFFFTNALYLEEVSKQIKGFEVIEISREKPFVKKILTDLAKRFELKVVGFESNDLTAQEYNQIKKVFKKFEAFDLEELRLIKEKSEAGSIKKACEIGDLAFEHLVNSLKEGMTEKELAFELEFFVKKLGLEESFRSIIAFGANSSMPHYQTGAQKLKKGMIVLMDFGVKFENYCSDMTRTVFFGKADQEQKKIYETVFMAQKKAIDFLDSRLGKMVSGAEVDKVARDYIVAQGFPSIPHSLGHGIGLEVHESPRLSPRLNDALEPGMVFSIEPGIYIEGLGGVRIEDLFLYQKNSLVRLTKADKKLIEVKIGA